MTRPLLLVSREWLPTAQAVWEHHRVLGSSPELHIEDGGRFLTASEAAAHWSGGGLDYTGNLFDALTERRLSQALLLLERVDGTVEGLLEFEDVPYAGTGMTAALIAVDTGYRRAILESDSLPYAEGAATEVSVVGNDDVFAASTEPDAEAEAFAVRVYRALGAAGWAVIGVVKTDLGWAWNSVVLQPEPLAFLKPLQRHGFTLEHFLERVLRWGRQRHDAEVGLRNTFKDRV